MVSNDLPASLKLRVLLGRLLTSIICTHTSVISTKDEAKQKAMTTETNMASNASTPLITSLKRRGSIELHKIMQPMDFQTPAPTRYNPNDSPPALKKRNTRTFFIDDDEKSFPLFPISTIREEIDAERRHGGHLPLPPPSLPLDLDDGLSHAGVKRSGNDDISGSSLKIRRRIRHPSIQGASLLDSPKSVTQQIETTGALLPRRRGCFDCININATAA